MIFSAAQKSYFFVFVLIFLLTTDSILSDCTSLEQVYVLRSQVSPTYVADASNPDNITIQLYDGSLAQQFKLSCGSRAGLFYIIHNASGSVLDVGRGSVNNVFLAANDGTLWQQWFLNTEYRIINAAKQLYPNLYISSSVFSAGVPVVTTTGSVAQGEHWSIEELE